jgi:hypothetical protein
MAEARGGAVGNAEDQDETGRRRNCHYRTHAHAPLAA